MNFGAILLSPSFPAIPRPGITANIASNPACLVSPSQ